MRLREIKETCPIYDSAKDYHEYLVSELHEILNENMTSDIVKYADAMLEHTDECRNIAGMLRDMCSDRADRILELEEENTKLQEKVESLEDHLDQYISA